MTLLPDVSCSEVEPLEIRLHSLHEGENAGSLLGTRMRALFLQHCRRRAQPNVVKYLPGQTGHLCRDRASANLHWRNPTTSQCTLWVSARTRLTAEKARTLGRSPTSASAD